MPLSSDDMQDWLRLLERHPEWKAEVRRALLTDELLELPQTVARLAEAQARTEARLGELAQAQARTEARLEALALRVQELAEAQARTEARLEELVQAQARTQAELGDLADRMERRIARLERDVAQLKGSDLERRFRERVAELVRGPFRRARLVPSAELDDLLEDAVERGLLSPDEADDAVCLDAVVRARRDAADVYLAVEVSSVADRRDVDRAVRRAAVLQRLGWRCTPAVAGHRLTPEAQDLLGSSGGVWLRMPDGSEEA